jgi:putative SOS response-associated peptidase YedK
MRNVFCHNLVHVRTIPTVASEADHRGAFRLCRLARRVVAKVQYRANPASPGDPPEPEGADSPDLDYALGFGSELAKDTSGAARMINARSETAATKPAFRDPLKYRRCLIPADAFYEWKRNRTSKQPYCFEVNNGELFAIAGLWDGRKDAIGNWVKTCSILTTTPNPVTSTVHDRMPVILDPADYDLWLDPGMQNGSAISELLKPYDARLIQLPRSQPLVGGLSWSALMRHCWS